MNQQIKVEVKDNGIAYLRMQDESGKNVFSADFIHNLMAGLDQLESGCQPKVLILSGLADVFCAGAGKQILFDLCDGKIQKNYLTISERLLYTSYPVIAAMEGHAVGGGLMLAVCADIVIAAQESRYGAVFMSLGFTPGMGCTQLLAELVGPFIANEMMYTAKTYTGRELAQKTTQINYILPKPEVMPKAENIALQISEKNLNSIYLLKQTLNMKRKKLLIEARVQEDLMHRLTFTDPQTRKRIEELYGK